MTGFKQGDIILLPFPFGERAGGRKRPALVISPLEHNQLTGELIIAQVTSRVDSPARPGDYLIQSWRHANLPRPALVRSRLATVKVCLVLRKLGELTEADLQAARQSLLAAVLG
jgi:mRNA interferase MazF